MNKWEIRARVSAMSAAGELWRATERAGEEGRRRLQRGGGNREKAEGASSYDVRIQGGRRVMEKQTVREVA